jgi:hypothetical protein
MLITTRFQHLISLLSKGLRVCRHLKNVERLCGEKSLRGFSFLPKSVSSLISNIYYDFEPTVIVPQFLSGNWGYFCFRREKNEQVSNHQPPTARVARRRGIYQAASEARQHCEPEARSGVERAVQGATNQIPRG